MKRVSVKDVARLAKVSIGTVSNFLNGTKPLSDRTRRQIEAAVAELGYRPNTIARSLRTSRTQALGMIVPTVANPFYTSIFDGAEAEALSSGYSLILGVTHYDRQVLSDYIETFRGGQVDGIIVDGYSTYFGQDILTPRDVPLVVIEPPVDTTEFSTIRIDNEQAANDAVKHLLDRNHRDIAILASSRNSPRFHGYCAALAEAGIAIDEKLVMEFGDGVSSQARGGERALIDLGQTAMRRLLEKKGHFTAAFVTLDAFAVGAIRALQESGRRVPEDVAVVGFDDIAIASMVTPSLTTIAQPHQFMGRLAVRTLVQQLQGAYSAPVHHILEHQLIVREST